MVYIPRRGAAAGVAVCAQGDFSHITTENTQVKLPGSGDCGWVKIDSKRGWAMSQPGDKGWAMSQPRDKGWAMSQPRNSNIATAT